MSLCAIIFCWSFLWDIHHLNPANSFILFFLCDSASNQIAACWVTACRNALDVSEVRRKVNHLLCVVWNHRNVIWLIKYLETLLLKKKKKEKKDFAAWTNTQQGTYTNTLKQIHVQAQSLPGRVLCSLFDVYDLSAQTLWDGGSRRLQGCCW